MFKEGQVFKKNGINYCVIDILHLDNEMYLLLAEQLETISYVFYKVKIVNNNSYDLTVVDDELLNSKLFEMFENKN